MLLFIVLALQWLCGVVSLGLTAYFMGTWVWLSSMHFMFGLCVACISSYTYFVFMWCAFIRIYKGYFLVVALTFSHLWLVYFVFLAIDYNGDNGCNAGPPAFESTCTRKYALEAFVFATFFFTVLAIPLDVALFVTERVASVRRVPHTGTRTAALKEDTESSGANVAV